MSSFSYSIQQQWITSQIVTCDEKWVLCNSQLSGWTQKLQSTSQSQTCTQKKIMVIVWWSAVCLIHYSFLNPCKAIKSEKYAQQIDEIHQKLQCLQSAMVNRMGAILHHNTQPHVTQPTLQKWNELGYKVLPLPPYSPDLLSIDYHFFKHLDYFLQGKHFHNQQDAENAFLSFIKSWSMDFFTLKE